MTGVHRLQHLDYAGGLGQTEIEREVVLMGLGVEVWMIGRRAWPA